MASSEFIKNRIEGKKKEIARLESKLLRIEMAKATNWEVNPYYYYEDDLKWTTRDLQNARAALEKLEADLAASEEKARSRDVAVILEFLEMWKQRCREFYEESFEKYEEAYAKRMKENAAYCEWSNHISWKLTREERKPIEDAERAASRKFYSAWQFLTPYIQYIGRQHVLDMNKINKDLDNEANAKYDFIIERTNRIVGQITDASDLHIGAKGDLNGYIYGTKGTAKVQTIGAGGYNIQCFHFRTLINKA